MRLLSAIGVVGIFAACTTNTVRARGASPAPPPPEPPASPAAVPARVAPVGRAANADSIVIATTHIALRVGEEYNLFTLGPQWRDSIGVTRRMGSWVFRAPTTEVYRLNRHVLRAARPGTSNLYIEEVRAWVAAGAVYPLVSTRITVTVRP